MANSVDPDQTAPIRAVCSGTQIRLLLLEQSVLGPHCLFLYLIREDFSRQHFGGGGVELLLEGGSYQFFF